MAMEADRMLNLKLDEKEVGTEREVILEERRSRTENNPSNILSEQMSAALYQNHPYRIPIIGWMHEMAKLSREDALAFYNAFAPNNAILVVTGDVTERSSASRGSYGRSSNKQVRLRPRAAARARRVELETRAQARPRCIACTWRPAYSRPRKAGEALDLLLKIATSARRAGSARSSYGGSGLEV
jgi:zinc protease